VGVGRGADISLTGFHSLWDRILSHNLQAVADQGCHLEGSSPYKGTAYRGVYCMLTLMGGEGGVWSHGLGKESPRPIDEFDSVVSQLQRHAGEDLTNKSD
jgi:hypothetical protein